MGILLILVVVILGLMLWIMQLVAAQQERSPLYVDSRVYNVRFFLMFLLWFALFGLSYIFMILSPFKWQLVSVVAIGIAWAIAWRNPQKNIPSKRRYWRIIKVLFILWIVSAVVQMLGDLRP